MRLDELCEGLLKTPKDEQLRLRLKRCKRWNDLALALFRGPRFFVFDGTVDMVKSGQDTLHIVP